MDCEQCGHQLAVGAKFCTRCACEVSAAEGARPPAAPPQAQPEPVQWEQPVQVPSPRLSLPPWLIGAMVALALCLCVTGVLLVYQRIVPGRQPTGTLPPRPSTPPTSLKQKTQKVVGEVLPVAGRAVVEAVKQGEIVWDAATPDDRLCIAARYGDLQLMRSLLDESDPQKRASPNASRGGTPALTSAISQKHREAARLLMDRGADINARDGQGDTPLIVALVNDDLETADDLLDRGADVTVQGLNNRTAEALALSRSRELFDRIHGMKGRRR